MTGNGKLPISAFRILKRTGASVSKLEALREEVHASLRSLQLPANKLLGKCIAIAVGSRGICDIAKVVGAACEWLREAGAQPFVFPGMGSHGGGTAEGQRKILEEYGVAPDEVGAEIRAAMETVTVGTPPKASPHLWIVMPGMRTPCW